VRCELGDLPNGSAATVSIVVTPFRTGLLTNRARVDAAAYEVNPADNAVTLQTPVIALADAWVQRQAITVPPAAPRSLTRP